MIYEAYGHAHDGTKSVAARITATVGEGLHLGDVPPIVGELNEFDYGKTTTT